MTQSRRAKALIGLLLVMMLLFATPAHASGFDAAQNISDWFSCTFGYGYC